MAEQRSRHLRVVRSTEVPDAPPTRDNGAYWSQVQALREQRRRLRAG